MVKIGEGVVGWAANEDIEGRYGCIFLYPTPESNEPIVLAQRKGAHGRLIAIVKANSESCFKEDKIRRVISRMPEVGEEIVLGEGMLFFESGAVGLYPRDARRNMWLDKNALLEVFQQTIELQFEEIC